MTEFFNALQAVLTIIILVIVGYVLQHKGKITDSIGNFLSFFVVNVTLPCSVFKTVISSLTIDKIKNLPLYVFVIVASQVLSMYIAYIMARISKIDEDKKGSFIVLTAFNNTLFMGLPISIALFGEGNSSIILYYYIASTLLFWTVGIKIIAGKTEKNKFKVPKPLYGMIIGIIVILIKTYIIDFEMPVFIKDTVKYVAAMTTPLSMIFTGFALGQFGLRNIRFNKNVWLGLSARFIVSPIIFIFAISLLPVAQISKNVFIVQAFMPVMASQTIIARQYGVDDTYPAVMVTISTILSLIIIPIVKVVISG